MQYQDVQSIGCDPTTHLKLHTIRWEVQIVVTPRHEKSLAATRGPIPVWCDRTQTPLCFQQYTPGSDRFDRVEHVGSHFLCSD